MNELYYKLIKAGLMTLEAVPLLYREATRALLEARG